MQRLEGTDKAFTKTQRLVKLANSNTPIGQSLKMLMLSMFPKYQIDYIDSSIILSSESGDIHRITDDNINEFCEILTFMFELVGTAENSSFNTKSKLGDAIANKLMKAREKSSSNKSGKSGVSLWYSFGRILAAVGYSPIEQNKLTLYQFYNMVDIVKVKTKFEETRAMALVGGSSKDSEPVVHWLTTT